MAEVESSSLQRRDRTAAQHRQISLPGCFGGFGLRHEAIGLNADAAFWAAWVGMNLRVPLLALAIGLCTLICTGATEAAQARTRLHHAGVKVDTHGSAGYTAAAAAEYEAAPCSKALAVNDLSPIPL